MNVIAIEDNANDAGLLEIALTKCGTFPTFHVLPSVSDARLFFTEDRVAQRMAELVVVDLNLGDGHGEELLPLIKPRLSPHAQLVVLTGSFRRASMDKCYELGADACFMKPSRLDELAAIFHHLLRDRAKTADATL